MKKIVIFTGSRADYGILKNLILDLKNKKKILTKIYAGAGHYKKTKKNNSTVQEILKDKLKIDFRVKSVLKKTKSLDILNFISNSVKEYSEVLNSEKPELVILLGDRYETFAFAISAFFLNIQIAHLHGGEVTQGSYDDSLRHSISKFSDYHFVTHRTHKKRLIQLGENRKNILLVGSLGVQNVNLHIKQNKNKLFYRHNIPIDKKTILATFHPETKSILNYEKQIKIFLSAIKKMNNYFFIFTNTNMDTEGDYFLSKIINFCKKNKNSILIHSLGSDLYFDFAKNVDLVIGNSSSGLIEIPYCKTPTLNIGNRQKGRPIASSVFNCKLNTNEIIKFTNKTLLKRKINYKNIYTMQNTKEKITNQIVKIIREKRKTIKRFNDIKF